MRIRTIKPSFWKSETLKDVSKEDRLLAVALLNYSDDEGYFQAHEALIRGECFPFDEDSTSVRRGLDELSRVGFLTLGTAENGQRIGRVVNFLEHQKIDKPSRSKFSGMSITWDTFDEHSTKPPRIVDEPSALEGNKEGKGIIKRATRLQKDWQLPEEWRSWTRTEKPQWPENWITRTAEKFRDYWIAAPKGTKLDWEATWRNWIRNADDPKGGMLPTLPSYQ